NRTAAETRRHPPFPRGKSGRQLLQCRTVTNHNGGPVMPNQPLAFQITQQTGHGFAGSSDPLRHFLMSHAGTNTRLRLIRRLTKRLREQQTGQLSRRSTSQYKVVDVAIGGMEVAAQRLRSMQTGFAVSLHQFEQMLAVDEIQLAGSGGAGLPENEYGGVT